MKSKGREGPKKRGSERREGDQRKEKEGTASKRKRERAGKRKQRKKKAELTVPPYGRRRGSRERTGEVGE